MAKKEADDFIELRVGEEKPVRLSGLGTAGYSWQPEVDGDDVLEITKQAAQQAPGAAEGSSADEIFTVRAKRPGKTRVRFAQRRSWERGGPAANEHVVDLRIDD